MRLHSDHLEHELVQIFFDESNEMLSAAEASLLASEKSGEFTQTINAVFRAVHSIKGGAQSLGLTSLSETAHRGEDLLEPLRSQALSVDEQSVNLMFGLIDLLKHQLNCSSQGTCPVDLTERTNYFFERLSNYLFSVAPAEHGKKTSATEIKPANSPQQQSQQPLFISAAIAPTAMMPTVLSTLLTERLRTKGTILYEQWNADILQANLLIQTKASIGEISRSILSLGDIEDLKIGVLGKRLFETAQPTIEDVEAFNELVYRLSNHLKKGPADFPSALATVRQLSTWGQKSRGAMEWFPGGVTAWLKLTEHLESTIAIEKFAQARAALAYKFLQTLWETVYAVLCNHSYYYSITGASLLKYANTNWNALLKDAAKFKLVFVDLNECTLLDTDMLNALLNLRDLLVAKGIGMQTISTDSSSRRNANILEATAGIAGNIGLFPNPFSATMVLTQQTCKEAS